MKRMVVLVGLALGGASGGVSAEIEDGLYGAAVPENAVFVRTIDTAEVSYDLFGVMVPSAELPDGVFVAFAPEALPSATPGAHYTVVATKSDPAVVIEEPNRDNPSKVYLSLLNVDASEATLAVAGGGPDIISGVGTGQAGARGVNPISVSLQARVDGMVTEVDVVLRRKQNLTFVTRANGSVKVINDVYGPVFEGAAK